MIKTMEGIVKQIYYEDDNICKFVALVENKEFSCINYNELSGVVQVGDKVLLNTTAVELHLGTGGFHFVITKLNNPQVNNLNKGHIMKLKYTPIQINCLAAETQESEFHNIFNSFKSLSGMPVIVGSLHSVLAPCCIYLKSCKPDIKICYIMTEGGALPIHISDTVRHLKQDGWLDCTVTFGNAFGGDYECVNVYTALITAKEIINSDVAIVCMGPGIVGTDTNLGFSGTEQASIADAVNKLGGFTALVPRISFADNRTRHYGISHHSITVMKQLCCTKVNVVFGILQLQEQMNYINNQIDANNLKSLHNIYYVDSNDIYAILKDNSRLLKKMDKSFEEDMEYFITCAASAKLCLQRLN